MDGGESMGNIWIAALWGTVFGVAGSGLGGLLGVLMGQPRPKALSCLLNLTGGLMIAVVCFELLPQAYALHAPCGIVGLLLGIVAMLVADGMLERRMQGKSSMAKTGLMVAAGIALHNLPEGLAVGSGFAEAPTLGIAMALMILLHDVPEGIAAAVPMRASGQSALRALLITVLSGLPTGIGTALGMAMGGVSAQMIALCMGLAGGAMLQITTEEMLPRAGELSSWWGATLCLALGVALGSIISLIV